MEFMDLLYKGLQYAMIGWYIGFVGLIIWFAIEQWNTFIK